MDSDLIIAVVGMVAIGIVTGLVVWLTTRNVAGAFVAAIERIMEDTTGLDAVEGYYLENVPEEARAVVSALVGALSRIVAGTPTEADDRLIELLKVLTDGEPNAPAEPVG